MIDEFAPYPIILTAYVVSLLACMYGFIRSAEHSDTFRRMFRSALLWAAACLGAQLILFGLPHYWSGISLVGKLFAQSLGPLTVFSAAGFAMGVAKRKGIQDRRPAVIGFIVGVVAIAPAMVVTLISACVLTGDCL